MVSYCEKQVVPAGEFVLRVLDGRGQAVHQSAAAMR
jgi:hypothetical protein